MKINGQISILINDGGMRIEIRDKDAATTFIRAKLSENQTCQVLSRLAYTPMEKCEVFGLHHIGKTMENKTFEFPLPRDDLEGRKELARKTIWDHIPKGWDPDNSYNSQDSFFYLGDKPYARTTIRRWVSRQELDK